MSRSRIRPTRQETRQRLFEAAATVFAEQGIGAASVAAITGQVRRAVDCVQLLTHAIAKVQDAAEAGGNRVLAQTI